MSRATRTRLMAVPIAALLAIVFTWPLVPRLATAGRVDSGDGRYGIWNVAWVARALTSDPAALYDANIFYPHPGALTFSEANLVAGVLAIPVWLATGDGLAAANSVVLLSFVLSALTMFALALRLTGGHVPASALAALGFAYSPFAFARLAHVQLLMTFPLPLTLLALHHFLDRPIARRAVLVGASMALTALACGYYGIFIGLTVGWGLVWFSVARGTWRSPRAWLVAAVAPLTAAVLTVPFMLPYAAMRREGFARSLDDARLFSANWQAYLASAELVHAWLLARLDSWNEVLFPGILPLVFALVAVVWSRRGDDQAPSRTVVGFYLTMTLLAAWASFGPSAGLYTVLFSTLPFFDMIRAPGRFGVMVTLGVCALAALGLAATLRRLDGMPRRVAIAVLTVATLAGSTVGALPMVDRRPLHPVYSRLAQMPRGAVAEFPYFIDRTDRHRHTEYMFESLHHWQPLINGYSDHVPPEAAADALVLAGYPSEEARAVLRRRGARYVVVHWESYGHDPGMHDRVYAEVGIRLRLILDRDGMALFEVMNRSGTTGTTGTTGDR